MLLFYISPNLTPQNYGGSVVAKANLEALRSIPQLTVQAFSIHSNSINDTIPISCTRSRVGTVLANLFMLGATLNFPGLIQLIRFIRKYQPDLIWFDSSYFGVLIPLIKWLSPKSKFIVYFQNIEKNGVIEMAKQKPIYWLLFPSVSINERLSIYKSDFICNIQESDRDFLRNLVPGKKSCILPIALDDGYGERQLNSVNVLDFDYNLFVGSDFPPNIEALEFLNDFLGETIGVLPIVVVGRGLEKYRKKFMNLRIVGGVDSLSEYYEQANYVLAPIYSGGGMKVKIAEALMYGKTVLSSVFAAIGYEAVDASAVKIFANKSELKKLMMQENGKFNKKSREAYELYFSKSALRSQIRMIINSISSSR